MAEVSNRTFPIFNENGTPFHDIVLRNVTVDSVVMSLGDKITGDCLYIDNRLEFTGKEYVEFNDIHYVLINPPTIVREGLVADNSGLNGLTKYSFEFYHPMALLSNFPFSDVAVKSGEEKYLSQNKSFSWIGKPQDYIDKLNKNLQNTVWVVAKSDRFPEEKDDELSDVLTFDNNTIADALKTGYETWDIPYVISQISEDDERYASGKRFLIEYGLPANEIYESDEQKQLDNPFIFQFGKGVGLKNNSRNPRNNKIVTRIAGYGSEDNVPYGYPQIVWYGDRRWSYTGYELIDGKIIIVSDKVINPPLPNAYPLYEGIVGGAYVMLIKHPFTRNHLMPSIYSQTVFNKVSPYLEGNIPNPDYDPTLEIKDYYDAIPTEEYPFPNPINPISPSYDIHEFAEIKPELAGDQEETIEDAYPINNDMTRADAWDDTMDEDGNYIQSYFKIRLPILSFDIYACAAITQEMHINMRSGACIGCTFTVQVNWDSYKNSFYNADGEFVPDGPQRDLTEFPKSNETSIELIVQKDNATFGTLMPNIYQNPKEGDAFVVLGISLPLEYISNAEERLDEAMMSYMLENNVYYYDYPLKFSEHFLETHHYILSQIRPNSIIRFDFGDERLALFVKQLTIKYGNTPLPQYDITLTDNVDVVLNQIGQVADDVEKLSGLIAILRQSYGRSIWAEVAKKLSKTANDTAQGLISFARGILFGNGDKGIDENGNATLNDTTLNSVQTPSYSGTDIVSDKGFKVWEDNEGKSHMMVDYFSARIKAFFASLEIRKIEHSAGNRIESPAGNTLALVKKFDDGGHEVKDLWYARRYTFAGVSIGMPKLVYQVANYFGVWKENPDAKVAYYRCYWTAEDKEDKKAVENNWRVGDQAFCQTFNLRVPQGSGYSSNKRYWRIVEAIGYETIEGTEYAYIDLSNRVNQQDQPYVILTVDGVDYTCVSFEAGSDAPQAGDDVACLGNQITPDTRGGALQYITYGDVDSTTGIPCVKMYSGINNYDLESHVIQKQSPRGVYVRADKFEILSASGTGSSTLTCERGAWQSNQTYGHNDIVQHHGSTWLCVVAVGTTTQVEPSESVPEIWQVYARRGASTPQLEVDSVNAVVSANYEGKIRNISAATGLPGNFELWIDGNIIPTADWDLAQSHVQFGNVTLPLNNTIHYMGFGIVVDEIAVNDTDVDIAWEYRPMEEQEIGGRRVYTHPVINPFNIVLHVVFDYHGDTLVADTTIPMIVQKAAASVRAQYSADNSSWHSDLRTTDLYIRYSYDDGNTWTQGTRFVGKSIEFERGIRHFASYSDLLAYLVSIQAVMTDKDMGYYIADTDDGGTPEATLWYFYTESSDPRDIEQVSITNEVNYFTSYDGHLWNADNTSEYWADMGVIQGADGEDGVSVTLDPATVIFEQDENNTSLIKGLPFTSTVRVWKGSTILSPSAYSVSVDASKQDNHCGFNVSSNIVTISSLNTDATTHVPYTSGKVVITVTYNGTSIDLAINWAANLLGTWKASVVNDAYTSVSSKPIAIINSNGEIETKTFETIFQQTAEYIMLDVDGFAGKTGIDLEDGTITLKANKVTFTNSSGTVSDKISIDPTTGTLHAVDGMFEGKITAKNYLVEYADLITFCYDKDGMTGLFIPGDENYQTMYDGSDYSTANSIDISNSWYFMVTETEVRLPNYINLVGQQVTIYNPTIGGSAAAKKTVIRVGDTLSGGDIIRGVGLSWDTKNFEPVPIESYRPVREIEFCDGLIQLQCVPSTTPNHYEWCVVNIGTNVVKIRENFE